MPLTRNAKLPANKNSPKAKSVITLRPMSTCCKTEITK